MSKQIDELMREVWQMRLAVNPEAQAKRVQAALKAALKPGEPIGYLAHRDGKPSWDEDCVCKDAVYPVDEFDDRTSVAIYTNPAQPLPYWYTLSSDGLICQCADEADAIAEAKKSDSKYPRGAPRKAVRLCVIEHDIKEQS
jgi:hypothetical protein